MKLRTSSERNVFRFSKNLCHFFVLVHLGCQLVDKWLQSLHHHKGRGAHALGQPVSLVNDPGLSSQWVPADCSFSKVSFDGGELAEAFSDVANLGDQRSWEIVEGCPGLLQLWRFIERKITSRVVLDGLTMPEPSTCPPRSFGQVCQCDLDLQVKSKLSSHGFSSKNFLIETNFRGRTAIRNASRNDRYKARHQRLPFLKPGKVDRSPQAQPCGQNSTKHERGDSLETWETRFHGERLQTSPSIVERVAT